MSNSTRPGLGDWRSLAEKELKGASPDSLCACLLPIVDSPFSLSPGFTVHGKLSSDFTDSVSVRLRFPGAHLSV